MIELFHYCPKCGHEGTVQTSDDTAYKCTDCGWQFWNNPRAAVSLVFVKDGKMLVSKRAIEPKKGYYDLPGGFVDFYENAYEAAIREAKEETTVDINREDLELIDTYHNRYLTEVTTADMVIIVHKWSGEFVPTDDSEDLEWKDFSFINDEQFAPPYPGLEQALAKRFL
jgi:ADP-ribose pyrophosphatase YjhB (NUDIX family)